MLLWCRQHPSLQAKSSCLNSLCNGNLLALLECRIYHQTMTKNNPRLSLRSRLGGLLSRPLEMRAVHSRMRLYGHMATLICARGTTILTNREPFEFVAERIFCDLQIRTRTSYIRNCHSEKCFHCI